MNTYQLSISIRADDDADSIDTEIRRALHGINENEPGWDVVAVRDRKIIYHRRPDVDEMDFDHGFNEFHNEGGSE